MSCEPTFTQFFPYAMFFSGIGFVTAVTSIAILYKLPIFDGIINKLASKQAR